MARIIPFWHRIPSIFAYGLRTAPLGVAAIAGLIGTLGEYVFPPGAAVIVWALILKYSFCVLERSAQGDLEPPSIEAGLLSGDVHTPFKLLGVLVLFGFVLGWLGDLGPVPFYAGLAIGVALLPAFLIVLGVTDAFFSAINPLTLMTFVIRIGPPYLALYGFIMLLTTSHATLAALLLDLLPPELARAIAEALRTYFSVAIFHLLGYVAFQFHEQLGGPKPEAIRVAERAPENTRFQHFERFMAQGKTDAAIAELVSLSAEAPRDLDLHRKLHTLLTVEQRGHDLARHAEIYLPLLLETGQRLPAAKVLTTTLGLEPNYRPRQAQVYEPLMGALREAKNPRLAIDLVNGLHERCADEQAVPAAYLLAARILCEDLQRDDQALKVLRFTARRYPTHPLAEEVNRYLATVERLVAAAPR